jgi:ribosomal protein S18 acetylase RimI-like enzyme
MNNRPDPGLLFRPARREDTAATVALILQGDAVTPLSPEDAATEAAHPDYLTAFDVVAASPGVEMFVAEQKGVVVGTIKVVLVPGLAGRGRIRARLESVHVASGLRGQGIGAAMVAFAESFSSSQGASSIELTSNSDREAAHRFYRRLGYAQSHAGFRKTL